MDYIEDVRQEKKVRHKLKDIIVIVLFATLANMDDWVEMEFFAHYHQDYLRKYIERTAFAWGKKRWKKKAMRSQRFLRYWKKSR